jgi:hypothetical protein
MTDADLITIVIEPKPDLLARQGGPERDPMYRLRLALKRLLRDYGLRCVMVRNPNPDERDSLTQVPENPHEATEC